MNNGAMAGGLLMVLSAVTSSAQVEKEYLLARENVELPLGSSYLQVYKTRMPNTKVEFEGPEFSSVGKMRYQAEEERLIEFPQKDEIRTSVKSMTRERKMTYEGQEPVEEEESHEIVGKTVLFERREGTWTGQVEGEKGLEDEHKEVAEYLERMILYLNSDGDLKRYGAKPRKVGDRWEAEPGSQPMMSTYRTTGGTYQLHFKEVKEFLGEPCAVIEAEFDITAVGLVGTEKGLRISSKGSSRTIRSLKTFIDYKYSESADYSMKGPVEGEGSLEMEGKMKLDARMIPQAGEETAKEAKQ